MNNGKIPVSVFLIAKDEEGRIPCAINSVKDWVDEVIVVDSGSCDNTVEISKNLGAHVYFNEWKGYGPQKVFGESLCRNKWILNIDADEEVSNSLKEEIVSLFFGDEIERASGYRVPILPLYPFQEKGNKWTITNYPIRLYRIDHGGFSSSTVHDSVIISNRRVERLHGFLVHRSFKSLTHHLEKINSYTSAQARDAIERNRVPSLLALITVFPFSFIKSFFLRREFVNGADGIVISGMYAVQRFVKLAKIREAASLKSKHTYEHKRY